MVIKHNQRRNVVPEDYYSQWVDVYKEGAIREVTMKKYKLTQAWLRKLIPDLKLRVRSCELSETSSTDTLSITSIRQQMDFHHQLKGAILDAVDEGLIQRETPTEKQSSKENSRD